MAPIKASDFTLTSSWTCSWWLYIELPVNISHLMSSATDASLASETVTFTGLSIPSGAKVKSAKVHSSWGGSLYGIDTRTVNGKTPDSEGFVEIEPPASGATSVEVIFRFRAKKDDPDTHITGPLAEGVTYTHDHSSSVKVSEVYLLIELEGGGGYVYRAENGKLVPYQLHHAENGKLVPYRLHKAEGGQLVPY